MGSLVHFLKEFRSLDLAFSLKNTLSSQLLLKHLGILMRLGIRKNQCVNVHIVMGALSNFFSRISAPGLNIFFEKYIVFATPPQPFGRF
jgi:hypothetical protein